MSATRSPIAASPSPSDNRTPPSGQSACAPAPDGVGRTDGAAPAHVGPGAASGAGGVSHPTTTPAKTAPQTTPATHRKLTIPRPYDPTRNVSLAGV
ncbi:hypothetical protein ACFVYT_01925 [Streptomyces sp. NPDC058290]|uniref:hypothetical protein n=1 Tax=Streptomyces sp. NPDC058290 TaxID=3346426 RepID=UPI0036EF5602